MSTNNAMIPGPQGKTPRQYEVEKGHKTESYIVAIMGNKVPPPVKFVKVFQLFLSLIKFFSELEQMNCIKLITHLSVHEVNRAMTMKGWIYVLR